MTLVFPIKCMFVCVSDSRAVTLGQDCSSMYLYIAILVWLFKFLAIYAKWGFPIRIQG